MRIWCQSSNPIGIIPSAYAESLRRHVQKGVRPDTRVDLYGTDAPIPGIDRFRSAEYLVTFPLLRNAVRAEREGYDAFACTCTADPGFHEIKEMVSIPTVFIMESSLHLACQLASKFGFVAHNQPLLLQLTNLVKRYGLTERMVQGDCLNLSFADIHQGIYEKPELYISAIAETARKVISRGADILIVSGNPLNMFLVDQGVRQIDGIPILDVCGTVVKMAELMVDLKSINLAAWKYRSFAAPSKEELAKIQQLYGIT